MMNFNILLSFINIHVRLILCVYLPTITTGSMILLPSVCFLVVVLGAVTHSFDMYRNVVLTEFLKFRHIERALSVKRSNRNLKAETLRVIRMKWSMNYDKKTLTLVWHWNLWQKIFLGIEDGTVNSRNTRYKRSVHYIYVQYALSIQFATTIKIFSFSGENLIMNYCNFVFLCSLQNDYLSNNTNVQFYTVWDYNSKLGQ